MFFKCKVCLEKDKRLKDAQNEIQFLRSLLRSPELLASDIEMNKMLEGANSQIIDIRVPSEDENKENLTIEREAVQILTGNY